mgnify:CR=1 FL=1
MSVAHPSEITRQIAGQARFYLIPAAAITMLATNASHHTRNTAGTGPDGRPAGGVCGSAPRHCRAVFCKPTQTCPNTNAPLVSTMNFMNSRRSTY